VNPADVFEQQRILLGTRGIRAADPVVIARSRHVQDPAGHRDIDVVVGEFTDQREY
jgi:hypothetical protein